MEPWKSLMYAIISSTNSIHLTSSFPIYVPLISFYCLITIARTSTTVLNIYTRVDSLILDYKYNLYFSNHVMHMEMHVYTILQTHTRTILLCMLQIWGIFIEIVVNDGVMKIWLDIRFSLLYGIIVPESGISQCSGCFLPTLTMWGHSTQTSVDCCLLHSWICSPWKFR